LSSIDHCNLLSLIILDATVQLTRTKKGGENVPHLYELEGNEMLGSYLQIQPCSDNALEVSKCSIQWYCVSSDGSKKELISGIVPMWFSFSFFVENASQLTLGLCKSTVCFFFFVVEYASQFLLFKIFLIFF